MFTAQTSEGKTFTVSEGVSLLEAAEEAGLTFAYSCRTGRCSTCKCRVSSGDTIALHAEAGLTADERADGWILSCVRGAVSDVCLHIEDLTGIILPEARTLPCRIDRIDRAARDVVLLTLRLPPTSAFAFLPGQYIDLIKGSIRRSYSVAGWSAQDNKLHLHVRAVENGAMSAYLFGGAKEGDLLRLHGPVGTFFLRSPRGRHVVFLATGTGIAPVKTMLEQLAALPPEQRPLSTLLLWGGRQPQDIYWQPSETGAVMEWQPVLSRAAEDWAGLRGHVQQALLQRQPNLANTTVYACGSEAMIKSARALLTASGLSEMHFHADAFVSSAPV